MPYYEAENDYNQHSIEYVDNMPLRQQQVYRPTKSRHPQDMYDDAKNKLPTIKKRTKAESLAIVRIWKRWLVASSVVAFGAFGGLALTHTIGVTTRTSTTPSSSSQSSQSNSQSQTNTNSNGGFFQQQQGGNSFGNSNQSQGAVSGSSAS